MGRWLGIFGQARVKLILQGLCLLSLVSAASAYGSNQGQALSKERMEPVIRQYIFDRVPWKPENLEIRLVPFQPVIVPSGVLSFRVLKPAQGLTPGLHSFLVAADVAGKEEARVWVKTDIKVFDDVVITAVPLAYHEMIDDKDVRVARRDISSLSSKPFTQVDDVVGRQIVRSIEANEVLTQKLLEQPTLIKRGSSITLVYESGSLRVETAGTAEEGGKAGDFIQVKNSSSGKVLRGVVLNARSVRVN